MESNKGECSLSDAGCDLSKKCNYFFIINNYN